MGTVRGIILIARLLYTHLPPVSSRARTYTDRSTRSRSSHNNGLAAGESKRATHQPTPHRIFSHRTLIFKHLALTLKIVAHTNSTHTLRSSHLSAYDLYRLCSSPSFPTHTLFFFSQ